MKPVPALSQAEVLDGLIDAVKSDAGKRPLVVFDLDDTLLSTSRRHVRILDEFTARPETLSRYPLEIQPLAGIGPAGLIYSITETAAAAGVNNAELLKDLREFWFERFFANDYLHEDAALPGAVAYCEDMLKAGARVVYLTGRDESMREGTLAAFKTNGFPIPDDREVSLVLKPRFDMPDLDYKAEAAKRLAALGQVAGGFDNEPALVNLLYAAFPESRVVFMDTRHSGKPVAPHSDLPWIKDFLRTARKC